MDVSQENTMPNYACFRGADRQRDLINSVKTFLICDDLKPPYKSSNSQKERRTGDEVIKVQMGSSRMYNICQRVTATVFLLFKETDPENCNKIISPGVRFTTFVGHMSAPKAFFCNL